jgi:cell division protein FtsQ
MPPTLALPRRAVTAPRLRAPHPRLVVLVLLVLAALGGGWLWLRESSLVAVRHVTVTGVSGPQGARIAAALEAAARDMTTLRVRQEALRTAVEPYPVVARVDARPDFPHTLRITVHERTPVAALDVAGARVAVAADRTVLRDTPTAGLPVVKVKGAASPSGLDARTRRAVAVLAAAPPELRARIQRLYLGPKGWTAPLSAGPVLYVGSADRLAAKWAAAVAVLGDRRAAGATYLDLRVPERPAAGGIFAPPPEPAHPQAEGEVTPQP